MTQPNSPQYKFGGQICTNLVEVGQALANDWDLAIQHLERGYIDRWIEDDLKDYDLKIAIDNIRQSCEGDRAMELFLIIKAFSPEGPYCYRGVVLEKESLLAVAHSDSEEALAFICELYSKKILTWADTSSDEPFFSNLDATWRREVSAYFDKAKKFFRYEDLWKNHSSLALDVLRQNPDQLDLLNSSDEDVYEQKASQITHTVKQLTLLHILIAVTYLEKSLSESGTEHSPSKLSNVAPTSFWTKDSPSDKFAEEHEYAMQRAWFSDLFGKDERNLGSFILERLAVPNVAVFVKQRKNNIENIEQRTKSVGDRLFGLPLKHTVLGFAGLVLVLIVVGFFSDNILIIGAAIAVPSFVAFRPVPESLQHRADDRVGDYMLALLAAFSALIIVGITTSSDDTIPPILQLGILCGAGALAVLMVYRRTTQFKKIRSVHIRSMNDGLTGSARRLAPVEVLERIAEHLNPTKKSESGMVAGPRADSDYERASGPDYTQGKKSSSPMVSHGDGHSTTLAGYSIASDGTITTPLSDELSIDTQGRVNMKISDNLTLHSDGRYTTKMLEGLEVRSDGQISTDFLGFRVSSGGKDEKNKKKGFMDFWG